MAMPITLDVGAEAAERIASGDRVALRDDEGFMLGVLSVSDVWQPDVRAESEQLFGTTDQHIQVLKRCPSRRG